MQPQDFLAAVLPTEGNGYYCFADLLRKKHTFTTTVAKLHEVGMHTDALNTKKKVTQNKSAGSFFGLATYQTASSRKAANAGFLRCIYIDLDCGGGDKCYDSKKEAFAALLQFCAATGLDKLGRPWLNDSGGGIHGFFCFDVNLPVPQWLKIAQAFKATANRLGFRIDATVTDDCARVLRIPDTHNYKLDDPRKVTMRQKGTGYDLAAFTACLDTVEEKPRVERAPRNPVQGPVSALDAALMQSSETYFKDIVTRTKLGTGCGQIAYYMGNAKSDGMEPLWRGLLSIAQKCVDGPASCIKLTDAHPYDHERMYEKLDSIKGPYSCDKLDTIQPGICATCPNRGKITNPLALGRRVMRLAEVDHTPPPKSEPQEPNEQADEVVSRAKYDEVASHLPPLPDKSFFYIARGGVGREVNTYDKKGAIVATDDIILLLYNFYLVDSLREGSSTYIRFAAERGDTTTYVVVSMEAIYKQDATIKELARQSIVAHGHHTNDSHLYAYVRSLADKVSIENNALVVPPRYGWLPDGSFAVGDEVVKPGGHGYTFASVKLSNLMSTTGTKGNIDGWRAYIDMIQKKRMWGVLACMLTSFGSPLMRWAGGGTPAMMLHACHKNSGHGKSTAIHMAASVWGHPTQFPVKPATSATTMLQRAGMLGCMPLLVDEITAVARRDKEFGPTLVYNYAQGGHKLKGSGAGNFELVDDLLWNAVGLITSNEPLMERMLSSRDTTSFGEVMRLLEWHPTEAIIWSDAERLLKHALEENHGVAGRKYAQWLVDNPELAHAIKDKVTEEWRVYSRATDVERFWTEGIGALLAGAVLCGKDYANIFDFDIKALTAEYLSWVRNARLLLNNNVRNAEDILSAYTKEFYGNFVMFDNRAGSTKALFNDGTSPTSNTRGKVAGRVEYNVREGFIDYFIDVSTLKRYVGDRNLSYESFKAELNQVNRKLVAQEVRKDLLARTGGPVLRVLCLHVTREITAEEAQDAKDALAKAGSVPLA